MNLPYKITLSDDDSGAYDIINTDSDRVVGSILFYDDAIAIQRALQAMKGKIALTKGESDDTAR